MRRSRSRVRCLTRRRKRPRSRCFTHQGSCGSTCRTSREVTMWNSRLLTAVAMIAFVLPVQIPDRALGAVGDAEVILYRFTGVRDNGGDTAFTGVGTVFHCTNFSGAPENIRIVVRDHIGGVAANVSTNVPHLQTRSFGTKLNVLYGSLFLGTGAINIGTA